MNLILYTLLEPTLSDRLTELGVKEENLGRYFSIYPLVYSGVSILVDKLILSRIHRRACMIIGFFLLGVGLLISGPSNSMPYAPESTWLLIIGLAIQGVGNALSFVPIFPELIMSVREKYLDR